MWFSSMRRNLDVKVNNALDLTGVYSEVASDTVNVLSDLYLAYSGNYLDKEEYLKQAGFDATVIRLKDIIQNNTNNSLLSQSAGTLANVAFGIVKSGNKKVDAEVIAELRDTLAGLGIDITSILGDTFVEQKKEFQYLVDVIALGYKLETSTATKVIGKLSEAKKEIIGFIPNIIADIGVILIKDKNETISTRINTADKYLELYYTNNENEEQVLSFLRNKFNIKYIDFSNDEPYTSQGSTIDKDIVNLDNNISGIDILRVISNLYKYKYDLDNEDKYEISKYTTNFTKSFESYYKKYEEKQKLIIKNPIAKITLSKTQLKPNESLIASAINSKSFVKDNNSLTYDWYIDDKQLPTKTNYLNYDLDSETIDEHYLKLIVTDTNGNSESTVMYFNVLENLPPVANFTISKTIITQGDNVSFIDSSTDKDGEIKSYEYKSSIDGILSTSKDFTTSNLSVGTHTITLKVTDDLGAIDTDTVTITVNKSNNNSYNIDGIWQGVYTTDTGCKVYKNMVFSDTKKYAEYTTGGVSNCSETIDGLGKWDIADVSISDNIITIVYEDGYSEEMMILSDNQIKELNTKNKTIYTKN